MVIVRCIASSVATRQPEVAIRPVACYSADTRQGSSDPHSKSPCHETKVKAVRAIFAKSSGGSGLRCSPAAGRVPANTSAVMRTGGVVLRSASPAVSGISKKKPGARDQLATGLVVWA
jgi:hypothetical protein